MKILWSIVVGLAVIFLVVWAATRSGSNVKVERTPAPASESTRLADSAKGDAIARSPSGATIQTESVTPHTFAGVDLHDASPLQTGAVGGFVVVLDAKVAGKTVSRLTYHVASPQAVVFVKQEAVQ